MFKQLYYIDSVLSDDNCIYSGNDYEVEYINKTDGWIQELEAFQYIIDLYICALKRERLVLAADMKKDGFTHTVGAVNDYVSAIYSIKEALNNYEYFDLSAIHDLYYKQDNAYHFICEYRNMVTHAGIMVRDYQRKESTEKYINLDKLKDACEKEQAKVDGHSKKKFIKMIKTKMALEKTTKQGIHYCCLNDVVHEASQILEELYESCINELINKRIIDILKEIIEIIYYDSDEYLYTELYDETTGCIIDPISIIHYFVSNISSPNIKKRIVEILYNMNYPKQLLIIQPCDI